MKRMMIAVLSLVSLPALSADLLTIVNANELKIWCKLHSSDYLNQKGSELKNWQATSEVKGRGLFVDGMWDTRQGHIHVQCAVLKGSPTNFVNMNIGSQPVQTHWQQNAGIPIERGSDLAQWCKYKSASLHLNKEHELYNWTSSHWVGTEYLYAKSSWTMNLESITHECKVKKGQNYPNAKIK